MDRKSCTKSNFCTENKKTNSPFNEAAKLLVFTVATSGRRYGIILIIPRIELFSSGWLPPRPRPEYLKVPISLEYNMKSCIVFKFSKLAILKTQH